LKKLKVLNLYAGIGGNRKLWQNVEVTAVESESEIAGVYQGYFPDDRVIVGDAHEYLLKHFRDYDFIWSSPPCPTHSDIRRAAVQGGLYGGYVYPDMSLYQEIILLKHFAKAFWVVENVRPYYQALIPPDVELHRHYFWCNFYVHKYKVVDKRIHNEIVGSSTVYDFNLGEHDIKDKRKILRNLVNPEVGAHFLNSVRNEFPPMQEGLFAETESKKHA